MKIELPESAAVGQLYSLDVIVSYNMCGMRIESAPEYLIINMVFDIYHEKHENDLSFDS